MYPPRPWAAALLHAMHAVFLMAAATFRGGSTDEVAAVKLAPKHVAAAGAEGEDEQQQGDEAQETNGPATAAGQRRRRQSAAA